MFRSSFFGAGCAKRNQKIKMDLSTARAIASFVVFDNGETLTKLLSAYPTHVLFRADIKEINKL